MRCWEREELNALLGQHGFGKVSWFGAYDPDVSLGATDRLVVVAQRFGSAAQRPFVAYSDRLPS